MAKAKRILGLISGIFTIVTGAFSILLASFMFIWGVASEESELLTYALLNTGLSVPLLIFGIKFCKSGKAGDRRIGAHVGFIIVNVITFVYSLIAQEEMPSGRIRYSNSEYYGNTRYDYYYDYTGVAELVNVLFTLSIGLLAMALVLNIVSMCLNGENAAPAATAYAAPQTPNYAPNAYAAPQTPNYAPNAYAAPEAPAYASTVYGAPEAPNYAAPQAPNYAAPNYAAPQAPNYAAPNYAAPQAPNYAAPEAPAYAAPEAPAYAAPEAPAYAAPEAPAAEPEATAVPEAPVQE